MKAKEKVEKEITSVRQSQEAEAAANYRNEPQDCNRLPWKKKQNKELRWNNMTGSNRKQLCGRIKVNYRQICFQIFPRSNIAQCIESLIDFFPCNMSYLQALYFR